MKIIFPHQENDAFDLSFVCMISVQCNSAERSADPSVLLSAFFIMKKKNPRQENDEFDLLFVCVISVQCNSAVRSSQPGRASV